MKPLINDSIFDTFPKLESDRLLFRDFNKEDSEALLNIRKHKGVSKYMDSTIPQTVEDIEQRIDSIHTSFKEKKGVTWAITEKYSGKLIGDFGIWRIDKQNSRGEIGYVLDPNYWRKGYMTEALNALIRFGFNNINLHSYEANVNTENKNSKTLLLKFGFTLEAHFRENYYYEGEFIDSEIYCLLKSDII